MSRKSLVSVAALAVAVVLVALMSGNARAAQFDCSQPLTNGPDPTASDCLFILTVAVGSQTCSPDCICAPKGSLPTTATDALICLKAAVGQPAELACPCPSTTLQTTTTTPVTTSTTLGTGSTTTVPSTSTTLGGGGTTTTTLGGGGTTTTVPPRLYGCTLDEAQCNTYPCSCGEASGLEYYLGGLGTAHGPVGTQVRVNTQLQQGGEIDCGAWHQIDSSVNPSCDTIGCCERQSGDPEQTDWQVDRVYAFPCFCPNLPDAQANILVQCQLGGEPVEEHERTTDPCS